MQHESRYVDLVEQVDDVDVSAILEKRRCDLRRRRLPHQIVEPLDLLLGASRNESRSEHLPKCRIVFRPSDACQVDDRAVLTLAVGLSALEHAARVTAVQNQPRNALRMADRIRQDRKSTRLNSSHITI